MVIGTGSFSPSSRGGTWSCSRAQRPKERLEGGFEQGQQGLVTKSKELRVAKQGISLAAPFPRFLFKASLLV